MKERQRIVVDANALISRLLLPDSIPGRAVSKAMSTGQLLVSEATMNELADVLSRPKFDRYLSLEDRQEFFLLLGRVAELISILCSVRACRDPRDDKFLEVAVNGSADMIVTGDADLLVLHPFHNISILTPFAYLQY
jgi:putative PIN family toxin of toxin-antitoxin system